MTIDKHVSKFYNNDWFIYDGQEVSGPVNFSNILEWFYSNDETRTLPYYVCQEGMSAWQSLKDTIDLHNKLQQFSVEEEKNKFIEQLESQLQEINNEIKDSLSSSKLYSVNNNLTKNDFNLTSTHIDQDSITNNNSLTDNLEDSNINTSISSSIQPQQSQLQTQQFDQDFVNNNQEVVKEEEEEKNTDIDDDRNQNEVDTTVHLEQKTHQILRNQTKNRTYKKSLKVPPLSKDMELIILTNRLRLGKKRSLILSSIVLPILTCGIYFIYWLIAVQLELTKHLNKKLSNILSLCSFFPILNVFSIYHLLSLKKQLYKDTTYKSSRLIQFIKSAVLSLILPIFVYSFQKDLNIYWKKLLEQKN